MNTDSPKRAHTLRRTLLTDLSHTPRGYMQPQEALAASARLAVCPEPDAGEIDESLRRLEAEALIHCEVDALGVKRWSITTAGRAALADS